MAATFLIFLIALTATTTTTTTTTPNDDPCYVNRDNIQQKDLYSDPDDCHSFYHCLYVNESYAVGIRRQCAPGMFFREAIMQCMPEGDIPCHDACMDEDTQSKGCYTGVGCRQYFICSNTVSHGMCCPKHTEFNPDRCGCDESEVCRDRCSQRSHQAPVQTTVQPILRINETVCKDSWGTYISACPNEADAFWLLDSTGQISEKHNCPSLLEFSLETCSCSIEVVATVPPSDYELRYVVLWVTFNNGAKDLSFNKFTVMPYDEANLDPSMSTLEVHGGYASVPGLKGLDMSRQGSWCAAFKPHHDFEGSGGVMSNRYSESEFGFILAIRDGGNKLTAIFNFWHPNAQVRFDDVDVDGERTDWHNFCAVYDETAAYLYIDGKQVGFEPVIATISISHAAYIFGHDGEFGSFYGNIDDILIATFAMTEHEIAAYHQKNYQYLQYQGFFLEK